MENLYLRENLPYIKENIRHQFSQLSEEDAQLITPEFDEKKLFHLSQKIGIKKIEIVDLIYRTNDKINFSNFFG